MKILTEPPACDWLRDTAATIPVGLQIVELGVYQGGSLQYLCEGSRQGNRNTVYGIDAWSSDPSIYADRPKLVATYGPKNQTIAQNTAPAATLIRGLSWRVAEHWAGTVGMLFIDTIHTEAAVLADYNAWLPHLAEDAVVAFDDHCPRFHGVQTAVKKLTEQGQIEPVTVIGSRLAVTRRKA